ncbi:glycosyltransferase family 1 protein [Deltaproteobacteria bacterium TL4]
MKIGFDAKRAFCNTTGLGSYSRTLITSLLHDYPKHEYFLYTPKEQLAFAEQVPEATIVKPQNFFTRTFHPLWRSYGIARRLQEDHIDLFHGLSHEIPHGIPASIKTIVTIHDLIFIRYPEFFPWMDRLSYQHKFKYSCFHADKIIAVSQQTKNDIIEFYGVSENKIEVIYQSCDPAFYEKIPEERIQAFKKDQALPNRYLLFVGSLTERKQPLNLVKALYLLRNEIDLPLVLVGAGPQKKRIHAFLQENAFENRVIFHKQVSFQDLPFIYQGADLFVYPSVFEGFGIPIIEALFSKVPVVTSNRSCLPEAGGPYSAYVDPGNIQDIAKGIYDVLTNDPRRQAMIEKSHQWVQRFRREKVIGQVHQFYQSLLREEGV